MPKLSSKRPVNHLIWIIPLLIIGAIVYFSPDLPTAGLMIFFLVFILAFIAGADSQLKALRKMKDTPKSTIKGASQGAVELSGYIQPNLKNPLSDGKTEKAFWKYTVSKQAGVKEKWHTVASRTSHSDYILMEDAGAQCWLNLSFADYYTHKKKLAFKPEELSGYTESYPFLNEYKTELAGATSISIEEEWLPGDKKVFAIGNFVSSPSNKPPEYLKKEEEEAWLQIARKTEGIDLSQTLKGTAMVNTLIWNHSGNTATPIIISAYSERVLKRKIWFKFWLIIFSIIILSAIPVLILINKVIES